MLETDDAESPVGRFLASRGPGVHHLAFEVRSLDAALAHVDALGLRRLGAPRAGADGKRIAFLHPKDTAGVLVELLETPRMPRETVHVPVGGGVEAGGTVAVHVSGEGPPLVVLHGALGLVGPRDGPPRPLLGAPLPRPRPRPARPRRVVATRERPDVGRVRR